MGFPYFDMEFSTFRLISVSNAGKPISLFTKSLERNCKNKNVLKFDVEKDDRIIF